MTGLPSRKVGEGLGGNAGPLLYLGLPVGDRIGVLNESLAF